MLALSSAGQRNKIIIDEVEGVPTAVFPHPDVIDLDHEVVSAELLDAVANGLTRVRFACQAGPARLCGARPIPPTLTSMVNFLSPSLPLSPSLSSLLLLSPLAAPSTPKRRTQPCAP